MRICNPELHRIIEAVEDCEIEVIFKPTMDYMLSPKEVFKISRKERIGTNIGIYNAFISIGRATGPLLGGYFLPLVSNHLLLWTLVTIPGFAATIILILSIRVIEDYRHRFNSPVS